MVRCCCRFARVGSLLIGSLGAATAAGAQDISVSAFSFGLFGDGDVAATITQTMSGQVDVGWSVAPFSTRWRKVKSALSRAPATSESSVPHMLADCIPKESLQTKTIDGIAESVQDAVQFKFLPAPPSQDQLSELIRTSSGS